MKNRLFTIRSTFNTQHSTLNTTLQEPKNSLVFLGSFLYIIGGVVSFLISPQIDVQTECR